MNTPLVVATDAAGTVWFARPDTNGILPCGSKSWEWGSITVDGGVRIYADWVSEAQALADLTYEATAAERAEIEAEDALYDEARAQRHMPGSW